MSPIEICVISTGPTMVFGFLFYRMFYHDPWASLSTRLSKFEHTDAPKRFRRLHVQKPWTDLEESKPTVPFLRALD